MENISVKNKLLKLGFIVTDDKFGGWNNGKRMVTDLFGNKVGYMTPLEALKFARSK